MSLIVTPTTESSTAWPISPKSTPTPQARQRFGAVLVLLFLGYGVFGYIYPPAVLGLSPERILPPVLIVSVLFVVITAYAASVTKTFSPAWSFSMAILMTGLMLLYTNLVSATFIFDSVWSASDSDKLAYFSFVWAGVTEEAIKLICYALPLMFTKSLRTVYNAVFFAFWAGCCFAVVENCSHSAGNIRTAIYRGVVCTCLHGFLTAFGALILAHIKVRPTMRSLTKCVLYPMVFIVPAGLHGLYDFGLLMYAQDGGAQYIVIAILAGLSIFCITNFMFRKFQRQAMAEPTSVDKCASAPVVVAYPIVPGYVVGSYPPLYTMQESA